ncbi:AraC family transcriptional regulator [Permianibacter fluminis]|uniref:AraC family transcriptional regulator n=1 Tax=Permianibacter fluminis TaxID=2738515 RepID=UPI001F432E19|nr:AraC family transcriptional regulator [Permianibacter fluminis]
MSWVNTVIAAANRLGVASDRLLGAAGIDPVELSRERWPIDYITRLWRAADRCTGDPGFGLKAGELVGPASLNVVSFVLQSSATLREALAQLQKYQRLISDGGRFQILAGDNASWLVYHPRQGELAFSPHQIEAVLAAVVSFARWVTGTPARPVKVQCSHAQLGPLAGYRAVFQCPMEFEQAFNGLLLDNALLDLPLPQADAQLAHLHERYAAAQLAALSEAGATAPYLRDWLAAQLGPQLPRRGDAARALNISERTLARRLQAQRLSFEQLLDEVRRDVALHAVGQTARALNDIAQSLGFAEASTFYRAFQRWTGMTPGRWRKARAASANAAQA